MSDILHDIHRMPPVDTRFVARRWNHDRVALGGHLVEARVALQALRGLGPGPRAKFLVVGPARSGTTLLGGLLDAQPRIACTGELLKWNVWAPTTLLDRVAWKSPYEVWGAKVLSYQMVQVHRLKDPVAFLRRPEARGFRFVHLVRGTLPQTLSLAVAQASRRFHSDRVTGDGPKPCGSTRRTFSHASAGPTRCCATRSGSSRDPAPPPLLRGRPARPRTPGRHDLSPL